MAELTARRDSLLDYLPGNWQQAINTNPLLNALGRAMNRKTPDLGEAAMREYGTPEQQAAADQDWLLQKMHGPKLNPLAAEMLDKGGMLANFLGPGVKLPGVPRAPGRYAMEYPGGRIDYKDMDGSVHVSGIYTNPEARGQGNAKQALQELIAAADAAKRPMSLEISPGAPGVDPARLRQWYERLGFSGPDYAMTRPPPPTGIRAYHGSPHDFDRFDMSKIGTGEGAQAYGRGLYFAESEGVARSYRDALAQKTALSSVVGDWVTSGSSDATRMALSANGGDIDKAIAEATRIAGQGGRLGRQYELIAKELRAINAAGPRPPDGRMYEVNIKADPDQFLDWDLPLSQQPEGVKRTIEPALRAAALDLGKGASPEKIARFEAMGLKNVADRLRPKEIDPWSLETVTLAQLYPNALRDAGIPGIKYLDRGSRTAGQGSRNYVVFDDKLIEILRKYGLLPPVAVGAAAALNQQEPQL